MRLRSSQFVMLLLLACSVQVGEGYALRWMAGERLHAVSLPDVRATASTGHRETDAETQFCRLGPVPNPREAAAERTAWAMPHPASASAAVASFTGLMRA